MILKSVRIRHFKSIDDAQVSLRTSATLLVGPNAVGKSNIVDSLRFVRDAVSVDLDHAISNRGGMARVRQLSRTKPYAVLIRLDFAGDALSEEGAAAPTYYEFQLKSQLGGNYTIDSERAQWYETQRETATPRSARRSLKGFHRSASGEVSSEDGTVLYRVLPDQLALGRGLLASSGWPLARFIRDWRFSAIYPNLLRQPASPDKDKMLAEDGANWASVIKALRRSPTGRGGLEKLYEAMRTIVPGFMEVSVVAVGNYLVPRFRFASGADSVEFDATQLSDGTLRMFGILLALYQTPAPGLLVVEEPEQTVHPGVLGVLADAVREAGEQTQIILTTHSPNFVDHFVPEEIRVVSLVSGSTRVAQVKRSQIEAVKRRLMSLSDFMEAEGLLPEPA